MGLSSLVTYDKNMSNIRMMETKLPPGFRFHPRDDELVCDYLMKKVSNCDPLLMIEVDLNKCEPWDIPQTACVGGKEWYFYSQRDRKYATGLRTNRATSSGYWKATGKDRVVLHKGTLVGMKKTLVFYQGRAPKGRKTPWVMHEFRLGGPHGPPKISSNKEDWVLCRVLYKNNELVAKPFRGSHYGKTSSSSSPPIMDTYINFDQTQSNSHAPYELQVPCFSITSQTQTNPLIFPPQLNPNIPIKSTTPSLDDFFYDEQVLKDVSDNFAIMENVLNFEASSSFGDQGSCDSYLSEVGMSILWNPH